MAPCLPAYLSHPGPLRPFLPVLLNWFFCLHPFLFLTLVPQRSQLSPLLSPQPPSATAAALCWGPTDLVPPDSELWITKAKLEDALKGALTQPPKTEATIFPSHTPQRKGLVCSLKSGGLGIKSTGWIPRLHLEGENGICLGADSCLAIFLCSPHPQLFGCGSSLAHSPGLCSGSSSFHRCHRSLLAPSVACQVGLLTTAARVIPSKINI